MPTNFATPGVYVEERPSGSMPIEGVGTAVAAFVGFTAGYNPKQGEDTDPQGIKPQLVTSWAQYERTFDGYAEGIMLPHAVRGFFDNGGSTCYVVRVPMNDGAQTTQPQALLPAAKGPEIEGLALQSLEPGADIEVEVVGPPAPEEGEEPSRSYTLRVFRDGTVREEIANVDFSKSVRVVERAVNDQAQSIRVKVPVSAASPADVAPAPGRYRLRAAAPTQIAVTASDFQGSETARTGYEGLAIADNVTMVALPDLGTISNRDGAFDLETFIAGQQLLVDFCERTKRMAILDPPPGLSTTQAADARTRLARSSPYGAYYYPNVVVLNPLAQAGATATQKFLTVPPSGHIAGVWARTDAARGVWKAPANETVSGIARLETEVTDGEQGVLNVEGVNCIRSFGSRGIRIWGARTLSTVADPSWRYIPVRRLHTFVEKSLDRGTQWAVFEPHDPDLRQRVKRNINSFLRNLAVRGALVTKQGKPPEDAYFIVCDESNNPDSQVNEGVLQVDVGIAAVRPAEFILITISQKSDEPGE